RAIGPDEILRLQRVRFAALNVTDPGCDTVCFLRKVFQTPTVPDRYAALSGCMTLQHSLDILLRDSVRQFGRTPGAPEAAGQGLRLLGRRQPETGPLDTSR